MAKGEPSLDDVYDLVQPEFDVVDKRLGPRNKRLRQISDIPQIERDLYLVHDIVAITSNAGMMAWIHYHHDEIGWVPLAQDAFTRIGHKQVTDGLECCLAIYKEKAGSLTHEDDAPYSRYIWDHEEAVMKSLYRYLVANRFSFHHFGTH